MNIWMNESSKDCLFVVVVEEFQFYKEIQKVSKNFKNKENNTSLYIILFFILEIIEKRND